MAEKTPDVGSLRHRLAWLKKAEMTEPGAGGQPKVEYPVQGVYRASIEPLRGVQAIVAQQVATTASYRIRMRNIGDVRPGDRLKLLAGNRIFEVITAFRVEERSSYIDISANELIS